MVEGRSCNPMRYDCFIIWGNGLIHIPEIVSIIRDSGKYNIIRIIKKDINNMSRFIKKVYACDTVPWKHLRSKSRYLLDSPKECVFILVENKNPREIYIGESKFCHIQCENINETKNTIRSLYNPKFKDPKKVILPLPPGVSHDHCIHASDYESQVEHLLRVFQIESLDFYRRNKEFAYYIPWHIQVSYRGISDIEVDLDLIYANINKSIQKLEDTPHYRYVSGHKKPYIDYFNKNFGTMLQEDHFPQAFDCLIASFDENYRRDDGKKSLPIINSNNVILDGVHRCAILKWRGKKKIKCLQI